MEVLKGKLKEDAKWEKSLRLERPMEIHILLDAANADRKDVYKTAQKIQRLLNEERYDYESVTINANILRGKISKTTRPAMSNTAPSLKKNTDTRLKDVEELNE